MASVKWEIKLKEVDRLIAGSNASLFDRAVLLQEVYDDPGFRQFHGAKEDAMHDQLDAKLGDYGITFADASLMLRYFPAKASWQTSHIRNMLAEAMDRRDAERRPAAAVVARQRATVTRKEHEALQKRLGEEATRAAALAREIADSRTELERLRDENRRLAAELARAEGRIVELERALNRQLSAA